MELLGTIVIYLITPLLEISTITDSSSLGYGNDQTGTTGALRVYHMIADLGLKTKGRFMMPCEKAWFKIFI